MTEYLTFIILLIIDYYYRALDSIEVITKVGSNGVGTKSRRVALAKRWTQNPTRVLKSELPPPAHCDAAVCAVEAPPSCMNVEQPTYVSLRSLSLSLPQQRIEQDFMAPLLFTL